VVLPDIAVLEADVLRAGVARDWEALAGLLAEDFAITTAGWLAEPVGKRVWIEEVSARHHLVDFTIRTVQVRPVGDVVVALVLSSQSMIWKGEPFTADFRYTDVWAPTGAGDAWQLHTRHATLVPTAPA
jgi:ketosteroid isomerase-like protein